MLDLACGGGANVYYFGNKYKNANWTGVDINDELFKMFHRYGADVPNVRLEEGDWFHLKEEYIGQFDGIISLQALSWLEEWKEPLYQACRLKPKWIALSSLFYEGDMDYIIKCYNYERPDKEKGLDYTQAYYNIYSLPKIKSFLSEMGYGIFRYEAFEIEIDLPKPDHKDWGTYTVLTLDGRRLQISAAMLMPWYFVFAQKAI